MEDYIYTTGDLAKWLNLTSTTIRRYTEALQEHLSDMTRPRSGRSRKYTEEDAIVIGSYAHFISLDDVTYKGAKDMIDQGMRVEIEKMPHEVGINAIALAEQTAIELVRQIETLQTEKAELEQLLAEEKSARKAEVDALERQIALLVQVLSKRNDES